MLIECGICGIVTHAEVSHDCAEHSRATTARLTAELAAIRDALGIDGTGTVIGLPMPACIAQIRANNDRLTAELAILTSFATDYEDRIIQMHAELADHEKKLAANAELIAEQISELSASRERERVLREEVAQLVGYDSYAEMMIDEANRTGGSDESI